MDFEFNLRFPGQYFDKESGQHYNYFRNYEPATGRYLESDPIGLEGGVNTFVYVDSNSLTYIDSKGLAKYFWIKCNSKQKSECRKICEFQGKEMEPCRVRVISRKNLENVTDVYSRPEFLSCSCTESFCEKNTKTCAIGVATGAAIIGLVKTVGRACLILSGVGS